MGIIKELEKLGGEVKENEILAPYTTFKIGGPARYFYSAKNEEDFIKAVSVANSYNLSYFVLAGGSNILISDDGFDGVVIKKKNGVLPREFKIEGGIIICDALVKLGVLVGATAEAGLTGLEWAAGIPGTVGGAIRGNAGAYGKQMSDVIVDVKSVCNFEKGHINRLQKKDLGFDYRTSVYKKSHKKCIILSTKIQLKEGDKETIRKKIKDVLNRRKTSSTPQYPCAGCIFKNPTVQDDKLLEQFKKDKGITPVDNKIPAGYLIDSLGLKGKKIGKAEISDKNANFILNIGGATAENVIILISYIKQQVRDNYGIQLKEEVELIGF
jgi:UDP-N-acetylmuramate dehydrogenase